MRRSIFCILIVIGIAVLMCISTDRKTRTPDNPPTTSQANGAARARSASFQEAAGSSGNPVKAVQSEAPKADPALARLKRSLRGELERGKISREVIDAFLEERGRTALSLVAAWQETGDAKLLDEAGDRFPAEPRVQLALLSTDLSAEQRAVWIERFKTAAPDNPLANYYRAEHEFKQTNTDVAVAELKAAASKKSYDDYLSAMVDERKEMFAAAGFSPLEAEVQALFGLPLNYLGVLNRIGIALEPLIDADLTGGDSAGASELAGLGVSVASTMQSGGSGVILNELVAIALERKMLQALEPPTPAAPVTQPLQQRLEELRLRREEIQELARSANITSVDVSGAELARYIDILVSQGEMPAMRWLKARRP